jgi:hypothetical protein
MMPFPPTIDERYRDDPAFRQVVDMLEFVIVDARLTPLEVRQAAMLAAINYEMRRRPAPIFIPIEDMRRWFDPDVKP